jgi:hypothetical protein
MSLSLKTGGLLAAAVLGATALGLAVLLARDPTLLKRLVRHGAITYYRALELLAEAREELGDALAEALQEAEDELRRGRPAPGDGEEPASAA